MIEEMILYVTFIASDIEDTQQMAFVVIFIFLLLIILLTFTNWDLPESLICEN